MSVGGRAPGSDIAAAGIIIRHRRQHPQRVDVWENKVAAVANALAANVTPKGWMTGHLSEVPMALASERDQVVQLSVDAIQAGRAPVHGIVVVVVSHRYRIMPKILAK